MHSPFDEYPRHLRLFRIKRWFLTNAQGLVGTLLAKEVCGNVYGRIRRDSADGNRSVT